jgi:hypothetical protein
MQRRSFRFNCSTLLDRRAAGGTTVTNLTASISGTSGTVGATSTQNSLNATWTTGSGQVMSTPPVNINVGVTTTAYLIGVSNFGGSTMTCNGVITALRIH